jgi:VWFA-related protein
VYTKSRLAWILLLPLFWCAADSAQQAAPAAPPPTGALVLDVVVTAKSGLPIGGLQQQDFTVLDNKTPQTITSFAAIGTREAPVEIVLVIDTVNATVVTVGSERADIDRFLRASEGTLEFPIAIDIVTDTGVQRVANFSDDGFWLSAALRDQDSTLRAIGRSAGYWGATERLQMSLKALSQIVADEGPRPGRKIILWVSPGWPLLNGVNTTMTTTQQKQLFASIVGISTDLRRAGITVFSVDPLGPDEPLLRVSDYEGYLKAVTKPSDVYPGDVGLQVIAVQSGGLVLNSGNDVAKLLEECVRNVAPYYEISFVPPAAGRADDYHQLEVKIDKPGVVARTRQGYYAQPAPGS